MERREGGEEGSRDGRKEGYREERKDGGREGGREGEVGNGEMREREKRREGRKGQDGERAKEEERGKRDPHWEPLATSQALSLVQGQIPFPALCHNSLFYDQNTGGQGQDMGLASSQPRANPRRSLLLIKSEGSNSTVQGRGASPIQPPRLRFTHSEVAMSLFSLWKNGGGGSQHKCGFAPRCPESSWVGISCA